MTAEVIVLRWIHIVGGMFWVGATIFLMLFLGPVLGTMGPAGGAVMAGLNKRKYPTIVAVIAILTILSGLRLIMIMSASYQGAYFQSPVGRAFATAGGLAIVAFIIGMTITRPAMTKAGVLGAQMATADEATRSRIGGEMDALRKRGMASGGFVLVLLLLAVSGMAVARYMG